MIDFKYKITNIMWNNTRISLDINLRSRLYDQSLEQLNRIPDQIYNYFIGDKSIYKNLLNGET